VQNFTLIGVNFAEISVPVEKKLTSNLISDKTHTSVCHINKS